jgi:molybdenum cofactor cytidylyltransferase
MNAALLLAGGESRRMGSPKLLLEYQGKSLLAHATYKAAGVSDLVVVVVGAYARLYRPEAERCGAVVVDNPDWSEGLASSLRTGVRSLPETVEVTLVILPDQPFVPASHLRALLDKHRQTGAPLVFSRYGKVRGAPSLIHRSLFDKVAHLCGEVGAKALIPQADKVAEVALEAATDIDTPQDARRFLTRL